MSEFATLQREAELLYAEKERLEGNLEYVKYQLKIYEEKVWRNIESQRYLNQEFAKRDFQHNSNRVKELLIDEDQLIEKINDLSYQIDLREEKVWGQVKSNALLLFPVIISQFNDPFLILLKINLQFIRSHPFD